MRKMISDYGKKISTDAEFLDAPANTLIDDNNDFLMSFYLVTLTPVESVSNL
jgi:hypothetical protein